MEFHDRESEKYHSRLQILYSGLDWALEIPTRHWSVSELVGNVNGCVPPSALAATPETETLHLSSLTERKRYSSRYRTVLDGRSVQVCPH